MIKKTILFAGLLLVAYNLMLAHIKAGFYIPQTQFQENIIKAEEYFYNASNKKYVIVGSSLSTKIDMNELPENYFNLSFRGKTIYDGLELIKQSGQKPCIIFIETNRYFKDIDIEFTKNAAANALYPLKEEIPALQEKNRPVNSLNLVAFYLLEHINKNTADKLKSKFGVRVRNPTKQQYSGLSAATRPKRKKNSGFSVILKNYALEHQQIPIKDTLEKRVAMLHEYIRYFEKQRVQVVFFEMPVEEELCWAPRTVFLRDYLYKKFPVRSFQYIAFPDCGYFSTKDGLHLEDESARIYTQFLAAEISKLSHNKVPGK